MGLVLAVLAASAAASSGAGAKDLPRGRDGPRLTGCEAFGPGFVKVDGSDTCIKVSGQVRVESSYSTGGSTLQPTGSRLSR